MIQYARNVRVPVRIVLIGICVRTALRDLTWVKKLVKVNVAKVNTPKTNLVRIVQSLPANFAQKRNVSSA